VLTENDVISRICAYLKDRGWTVDQQLLTSERGVDIVASRHNEKLYAECKGGTSALGSSARFGKPFSHAQVRDHVGVAVATACELRSAHRETYIAIGLPDTPLHRARIDAVSYSLTELRIGVLWVSDSVHAWNLPNV
jgi:hypothetical protein